MADDDRAQRAAIPFEPFPEDVLCIDDVGRHFPHAESFGPYVVHENAARRLWATNGRGLPPEWLEAAIGPQAAALEAAPFEDEELTEEMKSAHIAALNEIRALLDVLDAFNTSAAGRAPRTQPLPGLELASVEVHADRSTSPRRAAQYDRARAELVRARELVHLNSKVEALSAAAARLRLVAGALSERAQAEGERTRLSSQMRHRWAPSELRRFDDAVLTVSCGLAAGQRAAHGGVRSSAGRGEAAERGGPAAPHRPSAHAGVEAQVNDALLRTWAARFHRIAFGQMRDELLSRAGSLASEQHGRLPLVLHWGEAHIALAPPNGISGGAASALLVGIFTTPAPLAEEARGDAAEEPVVEAEAAGSARAAKRGRTGAAARKGEAGPDEAAAAPDEMADSAALGPAAADPTAATRSGTLSALLGALAMQPAGRVRSDSVNADDDPPIAHLAFGQPLWQDARLLPGHATSGGLLVGALCRASAHLRAAPLLLEVLHALRPSFSSEAAPVRVVTRALGARDCGLAVGAAAAGAQRRPQYEWPSVLGGGLAFEVSIGGELALDGALADGSAALRSAGRDPWHAAGAAEPAGSALPEALGAFAQRWDELGAGDAEQLAPLLLLLVRTTASLVCALRLARAMQLARRLGLEVCPHEEQGGLGPADGANCGEGSLSFVARARSGARALVRQPLPSSPAGDAPTPRLSRLEPLTAEALAAPGGRSSAPAARRTGRDADGMGCVCAALLACRAEQA